MGYPLDRAIGPEGSGQRVGFRRVVRNVRRSRARSRSKYFVGVSGALGYSRLGPAATTSGRTPVLYRSKLVTNSLASSRAVASN
jgi:hypothetical protein